MTTATTNAVHTSAAARPRRRLRGIAFSVIVVLPLLGAWVAYDLFAPRRASSLRDFDPNEVARLETAMWRSYYSRERVRLFAQLAELLRTQYRLPFWRSNLVAYHAAKAAFVFKDGRGLDDYERALPHLENFYNSLSDSRFDTERAARLELEWWIVHRERRRHAPGDLEHALAELQAEIYHVPAGRLSEHARLRADAMAIRDTKADAGGVNEDDWRRIDELLRGSWRSLHAAVNSEK